jgi:transcription termination factor 2
MARLTSANTGSSLYASHNVRTEAEKASNSSLDTDSDSSSESEADDSDIQSIRDVLGTGSTSESAVADSGNQKEDDLGVTDILKGLSLRTKQDQILPNGPRLARLHNGPGSNAGALRQSSAPNSSSEGPRPNSGPGLGASASRQNNSSSRSGAGGPRLNDGSSAVRPLHKQDPGKPVDNAASKPSSVFNTSQSTTFFNKLQAAQQKRTQQQKFVKPNLTPTTTFGSPVKTYNVNSGALLEPLAPKSSQWTQKVNISAALQRPLPVAFESPVKLDVTRFKEPDRWGVKSNSMDSSDPSTPSRVAAGNSYSYIPPTKATDAVKELLQSLNKDDDETNMNEAEETVVSGMVAGLEVRLLMHQVQGLKFLRGRESSSQATKGGLLCDDMGLGKTVQSIALILSNPYIPTDKSNKENTLHSIKSTLVIAPLALTTQWAEEIRSKAPGLRVLVHHGQQRTKDHKTFQEYDVVVTTYQLVASEHQSRGPLFEPTWWRIIVDEAHTIKNRKAKSSMAACDLSAQSRWCLTGTPIQNSVDELQSLFKFLRLSPYNDVSVWTQQISRPINAGQGGVAIKRLHVVLSVVMLRRTKAILNGSGIQLPERRVHRLVLEFSEKERRFYDLIHKRVRRTVKDMLAEDGSKFISALLLLLRLRQICDDIDLANGLIDTDDQEACLSATEAKTNTDELADMLGGLDLHREGDPYLKKLGLDEDEAKIEGVGSTKIRRLLDIVQKDPHRKTIVFSQFTSMLDIIEPSMRKAGIKYVRYDGSMRPAQRDASLRQLREDPTVGVLLCSLKCGALGLNLTVANRVVLVDPWWNPMISEQAIDRVHRIGQTADVDVYEFIIKDTVEEKILQLQDKKRGLANDVIEVGRKGRLNNQLTTAELLALFE